MVLILEKGCKSYLEDDGLVDVRQAELLEEAFILAPEKSDIRDAEQNHGQPLQPQTKRPTHLIPSTSCRRNQQLSGKTTGFIIWHSVMKRQMFQQGWMQLVKTNPPQSKTLTFFCCVAACKYKPFKSTWKQNPTFQRTFLIILRMIYRFMLFQIHNLSWNHNNSLLYFGFSPFSIC